MKRLGLTFAERISLGRRGGKRLPISHGVRALTRPSLHHYAKWLGRYPDHMMVFCDNLTSWALSLARTQSEIVSLGLLWGGYVERPLKIEWVFPLCSTSEALSQTTAGTHDAVITDMLEAIAAADDSDEITIRLGWEMNITAYPWNIVSANSAAGYIDGFRHVVDLARTIDSRFKFTWCVNWAAQNPEPCYPGDDYVDVIGMDAYFKTQFDQSSGQTGQQVWEYKRDADYGEQWLVDFAAAHGKRWALCEWGGNKDEPAWMQGQIDFIKQHKPKYHGYWNQSTDSEALCQLSNKAYPNMGAIYINELGDPNAVRSWDPLLYFGTDLIDWWDATALSSFTESAGVVDRWYSEIGYAEYALGSGTARPARSATARNGLPGVIFDGTNDVLVATQEPTKAPAGQQAVTYAMQIYGNAAIGTFRYAYADTDAAGGGNQRMLGAGGTGAPPRFNASGNLSIPSGSTLANVDRSLVVAVPAGASPTCRLSADGKTASTGAVAILVFTPTKKVIGAVGATSNGVGSFWNGIIDEIITIKRDITAAEENMLHGYMAHKWKGSRASVALPAGHPYLAAPPTL